MRPTTLFCPKLTTGRCCRVPGSGIRKRPADHCSLFAVRCSLSCRWRPFFCDFFRSAPRLAGSADALVGVYDFDADGGVGAPRAGLKTGAPGRPRKLPAPQARPDAGAQRVVPFRSRAGAAVVEKL